MSVFHVKEVEFIKELSSLINVSNVLLMLCVLLELNLSSH